MASGAVKVGGTRAGRGQVCGRPAGRGGGDTAVLEHGPSCPLVQGVLEELWGPCLTLGSPPPKGDVEVTPGRGAAGQLLGHGSQ